ncbi:MAG TPA: hypothetical protein VMB52_04315 [Verrucomicrobiae bacterium]|nr:hypothetical protein [Verrucomicrobiae bacterium]
MQPDDQRYTYNQLSNEDRQLLLSHGYRPGELSPEETRELLADLRDQTDDDEDSDRPSTVVPGDERDDEIA